jgi:hypothetical protein
MFETLAPFLAGDFVLALAAGGLLAFLWSTW